MNVSIGTWLVPGTEIIVVDVKITDHRFGPPNSTKEYLISPVAGRGECWVPTHQITNIKPCIREIPHVPFADQLEPPPVTEGTITLDLERPAAQLRRIVNTVNEILDIVRPPIDGDDAVG